MAPDTLFQTLVETAADGIIVIDADAIVHTYSTACEKLFGYTSAEVVGQNVKMLMPAPYREEHDGYVRNYQATGVKRIIGIGREVVGRRKDGTTFPMYLSVGEGSLKGRRIYVGIIHDLTAQRAAARRFQELQSDLLHVSRLSAMGQMTAALAHELNQPLTAIMNYVTAAKRMMGQKDDEATLFRARDLVDKAGAQTTRAGQIIRRLRDFVEKRDSDRKEQCLNEVVEEAIALAFAGFSHTNAKVRTDLAPALPLVMIDKIQVQQVLINLIRNSIEAMKDSPTRNIILSTAATDSGVRCSVADTGPGLPAEVTSRLFQPFVTTKEMGMGIGLSICQSIIEAHDGRIWAVTNEWGGATFHIELPAAQDS